MEVFLNLTNEPAQILEALDVIVDHLSFPLLQSFSPPIKTEPQARAGPRSRGRGHSLGRSRNRRPIQSFRFDCGTLHLSRLAWICRLRAPLEEDHASEYLADAVKRVVSLPRSAHDIGVSGIAIDEQHLDLLVFSLRKKDVAAHREVLAHFVGFECDRTDLLIGLIVR